MIPSRPDKPARTKTPKVDLDFEIRFFEGVIARDPNYVEALQILGDAYTKTGQWAKGLAIDERLAHLCPTNSVVFYNLACSYSLLNRLDEAFEALEQAVKLGYKDTRWLTKDPDLENLRRDARFVRVRETLIKKHPAGDSAA